MVGVGAVGGALQARVRAQRRVVLGLWLTGAKDGGWGGDPLSDPLARDYAARDFKRFLKVERGLRPASVNLALASLDSLYRCLGLGSPNVRREELPSSSSTCSLLPSALALARASSGSTSLGPLRQRRLGHLRDRADVLEHASCVRGAFRHRYRPAQPAQQLLQCVCCIQRFNLLSGSLVRNVSPAANERRYGADRMPQGTAFGMGAHCWLPLRDWRAGVRHWRRYTRRARARQVKAAGGPNSAAR
jgi:hypothetical protein